MAPSKAARTPRKPAAGKPPASKKKALPNASILTYFKKTEQSLFIGDGQPMPEFPQGVEEEDIYGVEDEATEKRFNEVNSSIKKRKLSSSPPAEEPFKGASSLEAPPSNEVVEEQSLPPMQSPEPTSKTPSDKPASSTNQKPVKKGFHNPFIEDSSDDDDGGGESTRPTSGPSRSETSSKPDTKSPTARFEPSIFRKGFEDSTDILHPQEADRESRPHELPGPAKGEDESGKGEDQDGGWGDFGEFDDLEVGDFEDDNIAGEEYRAMRYMEEQARLEEEAGNYSCDDELARPALEGSMTESCPICNGDMAGVSPEEATAHVNACLDGNPTPLPCATRETDQKVVEEVDSPELSKRFARAAVPRPGQANPFTLGGPGPGVSSSSAFAKMMSSHAEDAAWATAAAVEHAARGQPAYKRTCPFYKIMPGFLICVDAFRYGAVQDCKAYFLSHFHSDHYIGLTANWTHGPIYCSKVTGSLVKNQLKTAEKFVVELEFEETVPIPGTDACVTMIPANHCPGSSLFLFEKVVGGRKQRILHCGDFRACPAQVAHPQLRPETVDAISGKTKQQKIDVCYLDTTYLNPRYSFPPQTDVIRACADACVALNDSLKADNEAQWNSLLRTKSAAGSDDVSKFFKGTRPSDAGPEAASAPDAFTALKHGNRNRLLVVCGTYSIGKERICKAIALALKTKIFASPAKIRICRQLGDPELAALMTSNPREAQVHMQMLMEIRAETLADYLDAYRADFGRIVGFRPSGWNYRPEGGKAVSANLQPSALATTTLLHGQAWRPRFGARDLVPQRGSGKEAICFGVPYSEHSSFRELAMFLMALRIEKVIPTVNVGSEVSRKRMKGWIDRWVAERRKGGLIQVLEDDNPGGEAKGTRKEGEPLWDGKSGKGGGVQW